MDIYREKLLDHYNNPRNYGEMPDADITSDLANISCGDSIKMQIKVLDGKITAVQFTGEGCAVAIASASMLTEYALGKTVAEIEALSLEEFLAIMGLEFTMSRIKCANLGLETLKKCGKDLIAKTPF